MKPKLHQILVNTELKTKKEGETDKQTCEKKNENCTNFKNRNGCKGMFQMKDTRGIIILLCSTENATLKQTLNGACPTAQRLASSV